MTKLENTRQMCTPDVTDLIVEHVSKSDQLVSAIDVQDHFGKLGLSSAQIAAANAYGVQQHYLHVDERFRLSVRNK